MTYRAEYRTIEVAAYADEAGKPTCCAQWPAAKCQFMTARKFGLVEVCNMTGRDVERESNEGLLRPHEGCPVWGEKE